MATATGAGLMFFFDPARGRRRRSLVRDKAIAEWRAFSFGLQRAVRDAAHRGRGFLAELRAAFQAERAPDLVVHERVRARLGRAVSHPDAICTEVKEGRLTLAGPVLAQEASGLISALAGVRGVREVENRLELHEHSDRVPALQGAARRRGPRFELMQASWAPSARAFVALAGAWLSGRGVRRHGAIDELLGVGLIMRAATNLPLKRLFGVGAGRRAIDFQKTINIRAPLEEVFAFWQDVRNYSRFMSHVKEVRVSDDGQRSHWVVYGPAGSTFEWDAEVTKREPNQILAWRSLPGAQVENAGTVQFARNPDGSTRLQVRMSYNPPVGAVGHAVASLFGKDPKHSMDDDLLRFKSLLEQGKATGHDEQVRKEQLRPEQPPTVH
jgi:uncharacterized membrane protein